MKLTCSLRGIKTNCKIIQQIFQNATSSTFLNATNLKMHLLNPIFKLEIIRTKNVLISCQLISVDAQRQQYIDTSLDHSFWQPTARELAGAYSPVTVLTGCLCLHQCQP